MDLDFRKLANPYIRQIEPYIPGKPIEELQRESGIHSIIKMASNENPLGPSPLAIEAMAKALKNSYLYPDGSYFQLKKALAQSLNIEMSQLTMGNGSENILEIIIKAYLSKDDSAVISEYAFLTIPLLIKSYAATIISVPALHFGHDVKKMVTAIQTNTKIIFIVNPNNPTGTYINAEELHYILKNVSPSILIVIDEAYIEYTHTISDFPDTIKLLSHFPNVILIRTFSKIYGLAGLRIGYAISSPDIADILNRARLPFNVNLIGAIAAEASLQDITHLNQSIAINTMGKLQLERGFTSLNINYIPSLGNFLMIEMKNKTLELYKKLLKRGIIVRPLEAYHLPYHLRISISTEVNNALFLKALKSILTQEGFI